MQLNKTLWGFLRIEALSSASCLQTNVSLPGLPQVPKNRFNQQSEKMQKERKIVKQDKTVIV